MNKEYKISIRHFRSVSPLFNVVRITSKFNLTEELLKENINNVVLNFSERFFQMNEYGYRNSDKETWVRLGNFFKDNINSLVTKTIEYNNETYYYYQLFYSFIELENNNLSIDIISKFIYLINDYNRRNDNLVIFNDLTFDFSSIGLANELLKCRIHSSIPDDIIDKYISTSKNDIGISMSVDYNKKYIGSAIGKIGISIFNSLEESIENIKPETFLITQCNAIGMLAFGQLKEVDYNCYAFVKVYNNKINMKYIDDKVVFYDGHNSFAACEPYLKNWKAKIINITQFSKNKDLFYHTSIPIEANKMVIHFINRKRIKRVDFNYSHRNCEGLVLCNLGTKKLKRYSIVLRNRNNNYWGEFVIPVDDVDNTAHAMSIINDIIDKQDRGLEDKFMEACENYRKLLIVGEDCVDEDDVLSNWFKYCTQSSKNTDTKILMAYEKMKKDLEEEYKQLSVYINNYDFNKCMPVPRLEIDKKLKNNYYNSLHIEPENIIIKKINKKNINPINEVRTIIKFIDNSKNTYNIGSLPINRFYDIRTNTITLKYNKVKGEVIRDKIKNRR